jgi:undecaprenyl-diphosphatase
VPAWLGAAELLLAGVVATLALGLAWASLDRRTRAGAWLRRLPRGQGAGLLGVAVMAGAVVAVLVDDVVLGDPTGLWPPLDQTVRVAARGLRTSSPLARAAARWASWLTGPGVPLWLGATVVWLGAGRRYREAAVVAGGTLGAWGLVSLLKLVFAVRRPGAPSVDHAITGYGFPSAHTLVATVACGLLAWVLTRRRGGSARAAGYAAAFAAAAAAGASRVVLGVHWTSDVVAGLAMGILWLALVVAVAERWDRPGRLAGRGV